MRRCIHWASPTFMHHLSSPSPYCIGDTPAETIHSEIHVGQGLDVEELWRDGPCLSRETREGGEHREVHVERRQGLECRHVGREGAVDPDNGEGYGSACIK